MGFYDDLVGVKDGKAVAMGPPRRSDPSDSPKPSWRFRTSVATPTHGPPGPACAIGAVVISESDSQGRAALRWFADRSDPTRLLHGRYGELGWEALRPAIIEMFDLDRTHHFLRAAPSFLNRVHERQITMAMRNVLEHEPQQRLENCQALMNACGADEDDPLARVVDIEADDSRRRLDLAIHAITRSGRPRCLLIEAKFKASLQPRQLERYQALVTKDYPATDQRMLRIVGSEPPAGFGERSDRQREWQFLHWTTLLQRWQRALPDRESKLMLELMAQIWRQK